MDKVYLRHLFEENKTFLKHLSIGENANKILNNASDGSLDVILRILFLIATGEITLHESHEDTIKKSKRLRKLSAFESRPYFLASQCKIRKISGIKAVSKTLSIFVTYFFS